MNSLYLSLMGLFACQNTGNFNEEFLQRRAEIYDNSSGSNLEEKLSPGLEFAVVLVDMQPRFLERGFYPYELSEMISEQKKVLKAAEQNDIPVLVFEFSGYGETIPSLQDLIEKVPRHKTFEKKRNDGFEIYDSFSGFNPEFFPSDWLGGQDVNALYFMGVNGSACVVETAGSANKIFGYKIATSNEVIATSNENSQSGNCNSESCNEAKDGLVLFLENGILDQKNEAFLDYLQKR